MSKIGKLPISLQDVTFMYEMGKVQLKGIKGEVEYIIPPGIDVAQQEGKLTVTQKIKDEPKTKAMFGLTRATLANLVKGVSSGFEKKLELVGVGYRAQMQGETLVLSLGFAHQVKFTPRAGVKISVTDNIVSISGIYKDEVGEAAAKIRAVKPPEPYKGKGIKYVGERIQRKAGKAAKAVGSK